MNDREAAKTITGAEVAAGFFLAMAMHVLNVIVAILVSLIDALIKPSDQGWFGVYALFNPGITQYLYLVPLALYYKRKGEAGRFRGILIAMGLTILLNGACWIAFTR